MLVNGAVSYFERRNWARGAVAALMLLVTNPAFSREAASKTDARQEAKVAALFDTVRSSPTELRIFLRSMPKGGDLHNHLGGAIYAEDFLTWGAQRGFCVDASGLGVEPPPCPAERGLEQFGTVNGAGYDRLINAMSTRGWQRGVRRNDLTGHNQFFGTFGRFGAIAQLANAEMITSARRIAAGDSLSYLELDHNTETLTAAIPEAPEGPLSERDLAARFAAEASVLQPLIAKASRELDADEAKGLRSMACGTAAADPGCDVAVHYLFQGFRALPPGQVYRSLILGFMMAASDPRYVGVNIVMPEDALPARRDYRLHMAMFRYLSSRYPDVKLTLHAGEVALGLVPPEDLRDHIAQAISVGARRIGHGTGIALEDAAEETMAEMARKGIAVEINISSNDVILGVKGDEHPLNLYRAHGVPVVLSTDDQGVLRSDMTNEYVRAVREHGLGYGDLKTLARAGLEYSFLPGKSFWADAARLVPVDICADDTAAACATYLAANEKARLQLDLDRRLDRFEAGRLARAEAKR